MVNKMRSKKAVYNIITNLILQIIILLYGFLIPKIIIKNFGSSVNGLVTSITQFLGYIMLLESGFCPVVKSLLYKPIANKDYNTIKNILKTAEIFFKKIAYIFIIYILFLAVLYPIIINNEFDFVFTSSLIIIISISIFAEYYFGMVYRLYLQAEQKNYIISIIQIISYILSTFSIIVMVRFHASIHFIKLIGGLIFVLRPILQNLYVKKKYNITFDESDGKYEIKQKWDGLIQHIAYVIHSNTDVVVLTLFSTLNNVSIYSIYHMVTTGIKSLSSSFLNGIDSSFGDMIAKNEIRNLNNKYGIYETAYLIIISILYISTMILIVPFVSVYTKSITDANYIQYTFGYLIVVAQFIWSIRQPYNELIKAAGRFKETKKGAIVEALSNIIISIILVSKYGLVGVAIGTIVAMSLRTIEFIYYTNKHILNRSLHYSIKKIILVIIESIMIFYFSRYLPYLDNINYLNWFANATITVFVTFVVVMLINLLFCREELYEVFKVFRHIISKMKMRKDKTYEERI